jgi:hypothetical protein
MVLKDLMAEEGSNLKLMWVPAHVGIKGNETVDRAAEKALNQEVDNTYKVKLKSWPVRQDEWESSGNPMAMVKPNIRKYSSTEGLARRQQSHTD